MKKLSLALLTLVATSAFGAENPSAKINIDWRKPDTLREYITQQCDDTYYPNVEVKVPGRPGRDFVILMTMDVGSGRPVLPCTIRKVDGTNSTTYVLDSTGTGETCVIRIDQIRKDLREKPRHAEIEISGEC